MACPAVKRRRLSPWTRVTEEPAIENHQQAQTVLKQMQLGPGALVPNTLGQVHRQVHRQVLHKTQETHGALKRYARNLDERSPSLARSASADDSTPAEFGADGRRRR